MPLTIVVVDESNNAALFNRMQICLSSINLNSNRLQCEKDYKSLIVRLSEQKTQQKTDQQASSYAVVQLRFAKILDVSTKSDADICYYLQGADKRHFTLDKRTAELRPRGPFDRETRDRYELYIRASEH